MSDGTGLVEKFRRACVSILIGAIAIYCAVAVVESIWPTLVIILGIVGIIGLVVGGVAVYRKIPGHW